MLNNIGPAGLLLIAVVILILFGRGRIGAMMGEVGAGISSFRRSLRDLPDPGDAAHPGLPPAVRAPDDQPGTPRLKSAITPEPSRGDL